MKKVAVYTRVSTTNGQTTENQLLAIQAYVERQQGWKIVETYEDVGVSGAKHDRDGLDRLKDDCRKRRFSVAIVWKFDRLARSVTHLLETLALFREHDVDFASVTEAIDTTTPAGRMVLTFLGAVAEFEREIIRERVKAGMQRAKAEGVHCGRPRVGFDAALALQLHDQGLGVRRIAKQVGVSYGTVHRFLRGVVTKGSE
jgi:DNA invertase Pin-like site-specific DNA recombinase